MPARREKLAIAANLREGIGEILDDLAHDDGVVLTIRNESARVGDDKLRRRRRIDTRLCDRARGLIYPEITDAPPA
mgnify:CR=1 FL=1